MFARRPGAKDGASYRVDPNRRASAQITRSPHVLSLSDFPAENPQITALPKSKDAARGR
jgi:hypothetical protein